MTGGCKNCKQNSLENVLMDGIYGNYYFSYCEAAFTMRNIAVVQVVFTRPNNYLLV